MRWLSLLLLAAASPAAAQGFTDISRESGLEAIRATKTGGYWMSGLLFVDLDGDGDLDVITTEEITNLGMIWYENPTR